MSKSHVPKKSQIKNPTSHTGWPFESGDGTLRAQRGLAVVELIVAAGLVLVVGFFLFNLARFALTAQRATTLDRRASVVLLEGLAAARFVRDESWTTFSALPIGTTLYPTFSGGAVTLSTTDPGLVDAVFRRTVTLAEVFRDGSGNIAESGTPDADARRVTVSVTWTDPFGKSRARTEEAYLMKIQ